MPKKKDVTAAPAKKSSKGSILIVEDEKPLAHALELKMKHEGYDVQTALSGAEGLRLAQTGKFDVILLDIIMPEIDGFTLLESVRQKHVKSPVIILSNLGQDEDRARAKSLGVVEYFVKANTPISDIISKVKTIT
jgi:DNA-binding response OmpR family regulator